VHRRTARRAIDSAKPRLDPFKAAIDAMLIVDLSAPKKQRHTVRRILARLVQENDAGNLSYSTVRDYVTGRRREITQEAGRGRQEALCSSTNSQSRSMTSTPSPR
jgi:hypothetical protein